MGSWWPCRIAPTSGFCFIVPTFCNSMDIAGRLGPGMSWRPWRLGFRRGNEPKARKLLGLCVARGRCRMLTCNALEWQASEGGGRIIERDKTISVNNPQTIRAWRRAARWVGSISPPSVVAYKEWDGRTFGRPAMQRSCEIGRKPRRKPGGRVANPK